MSERGATLETATGTAMLTFDSKDPLLRVLTWLVGKRSLWYSLILAVVLTAPVYIVASAEGVMFDPKLQPDLAGDIGNHLIFFGTMPFLIVVSILYYRKFYATVHALAENGVLVPNDLGLGASVASWNRVVDSRWLTGVIFTATVAVCVISEMTFSFTRSNSWHWPAWSPRPSFASFLEWPALFVVNYLIAQLVVRVIISFRFVRRLFRDSTVIVQPLHPDRCGGLGPIGSLAMFLNGVVLVTGLMVAGGLYGNIYIMKTGVLAPVNILLVLAYLGMSAAVVFTPIWAAHRKMRDERHKMLAQLNSRFTIINEKLAATMQEHEEPSLEALTAQKEELSTVRELYEIVAERPVWPFSSKVIYTFSGSVLWPLLFFLVQVYVQKALG